MRIFNSDQQNPFIAKRILRNERAMSIDDPTRDSNEFDLMKNSINKRSASFPFIENEDFYQNPTLSQLFTLNRPKNYFNITTRVIENDPRIDNLRQDIGYMQSYDQQQSVSYLWPNMFNLKRVSHQINNFPAKRNEYNYPSQTNFDTRKTSVLQNHTPILFKLHRVDNDHPSEIDEKIVLKRNETKTKENLSNQYEYDLNWLLKSYEENYPESANVSVKSKNYVSMDDDLKVLRVNNHNKSSNKFAQNKCFVCDKQLNKIPILFDNEKHLLACRNCFHEWDLPSLEGSNSEYDTIDDNKEEEISHYIVKKGKNYDLKEGSLKRLENEKNDIKYLINKLIDKDEIKLVPGSLRKFSHKRNFSFNFNFKLNLKMIFA